MGTLMVVSALLERLAAAPLARRGADLIFRGYARRRVRQLDFMAATEVQHDTLLRLVRHGRDTRFGRDHGFATIKSINDYQSRVPLREYDTFWKEYWQPAFPALDDA